MKPPKPLPATPPFLTIYTVTHLRPAALARNLASVGRQTAVEDLEQIVLPDHVGYGLPGGLYKRVPWYAAACRGRYVVFLSDDDALAGERVVEQVRTFVEKHREPDVVVVDVMKGDRKFPLRWDPYGPPTEGDVDLGTYVYRRDVWLTFADCYGDRYQGDFDHALAMYRAGVRPVRCELLFATGPSGGGRPEMSL